jgi:hypothetical protein
MCVGSASAQQKQIAQEQQQFYQTLTQSFQQNFAQQQNILSSLQQSFAPILAAGINQYGFSPAEDAALRTQATSGTAQQYQMAQQATAAQLAAVGGGNQFLPSGAAAQLTQQTALAAAQQQSAEQLGITTAGYQQGQANYLAAAGELGQVAAQENPLGYAQAATGAGQTAFGSAETVAQERSGWSAILGGALGGFISSSFAGPYGAGGKGPYDPTTSPGGPGTGGQGGGGLPAGAMTSGMGGGGGGAPMAEGPLG